MNEQTNRWQNVFLFITPCIDNTPSSRFCQAKRREWNFRPREYDSYLHDNRVPLIKEYSKEDPDHYRQLEQRSIEKNGKTISTRNLLENLPDNRIAQFFSWLEYDTLNETEEGKSFRTYLEKKCDRFETEAYEPWKYLYCLEQPETSDAFCALADYDKNNASKFLKDIFIRLKEYYPASAYYLFVHGSTLIKDRFVYSLSYQEGNLIPLNDGTLTCPPAFRIKTFHHQNEYAECKFLTSTAPFDLRLLKYAIPIEKLWNLSTRILESRGNTEKILLHTRKFGQICQTYSDIRNLLPPSADRLINPTLLADMDDQDILSSIIDIRTNSVIFK